MSTGTELSYGAVKRTCRGRASTVLAQVTYQASIPLPGPMEAPPGDTSPSPPARDTRSAVVTRVRGLGVSNTPRNARCVPIWVLIHTGADIFEYGVKAVVEQARTNLTPNAAC